VLSKGLRLMANNAVGFLALFIALGGVGYAATGGFSSGGTLRACANDEGTLKLLKAGKKCKKDQKSVSWNQLGPAGAKGVAGAPGAPGGAGATGAAGQNGAPAPGTTDWARVAEDGTLIAGRGVTASKLSGTDTMVDFDRDVTKCGLFATHQTGSTAVYIAFVSVVNGTNNKVNIQPAFNNSGVPTGVAEGVSVQAICP
jgi:hypothetical protein